jgi:hypothetical protein
MGVLSKSEMTTLSLVEVIEGRLTDRLRVEEGDERVRGKEKEKRGRKIAIYFSSYTY